MLIFVYGDDGVRVKEKLAELTRRYFEKIDPTGLNFASFSSAQGLDFPEVMQAVQSAPFLADKRMVVVNGLMDGLKKDDARMWAEGLARTASSTITILVDELPKEKVEKHELYLGLRSGAEVHAYAEVKKTGVALARWLTELAKTSGSSMSLDIATELIARVGEDEWRLMQEVKKLSAYAGHEPITREMLSLHSAASSESNIFAFVDAVSQREAKKALQLLADEREAGSADLYLLAMLARQVRILLQIQTAIVEDPSAERNVAKRLGLHPYVAGKVMVQAKRFSLSQLEKLHGLLVRLDREAKKGIIDPSLAVDRLAAEMLASSPTS